MVTSFTRDGDPPPPRKWLQFRNEAMIRTPKQMKGFLGGCNWYSIYIPQYASLAVLLMDSLKEKYEKALEGGKYKVPKDRN